jgi:hypothetical protein
MAVPNARVISLRCFSLIRTLYSIAIELPLMRFNVQYTSALSFSDNVAHAPAELTVLDTLVGVVD